MLLSWSQCLYRSMSCPCGLLTTPYGTLSSLAMPDTTTSLTYPIEVLMLRTASWLKNVKCGDPAPFARWSPVWENKDLEKPVEDQEGKGRLPWFSYFFLSRWAIHSQECINLCGVSFSQDSIYFGVVLCEYVMYFPVLRSQYRMYFQPSFSQYGVYLVILKGQYGKYLAA